MRSLLLVLLLAFGGPAASAAERDPTPLRLVAAHAGGVDSDGERWVIVTSRIGPGSFRYDVYDTWTGAQGTLPEGCGLGGILEQTTTMVAGRALLDCVGSYAVIELTTARLTPLPLAISDGQRSASAPAFYILGRRWIWAEGHCGRAGEQPVFCDMYVDFRTGEARPLAATDHRLPRGWDERVSDLVLDAATAHAIATILDTTPQQLPDRDPLTNRQRERPRLELDTITAGVLLRAIRNQ